MTKIERFMGLSHEGNVYYFHPANELLVQMIDGEKTYLIDDEKALLIGPRDDKIRAVNYILDNIEFVGEL